MPGVFANRMGAGTQTACLAIGGDTSDGPTSSTQVDSYDGSSFSTLPGTLGSPKSSGGGAGTQTAAVTFGGITNPNGTTTNTTFTFDGSTWSAAPNMAQTKFHWSAGGGTASAAIGAGGNPPNTTNNTEEFTNVTTARSVDTST